MAIRVEVEAGSEGNMADAEHEKQVVEARREFNSIVSYTRRLAAPRRVTEVPEANDPYTT